MADTQTAPATDDGLQADLNTVQPASGAPNPLAPPSTATADDGISADINSIQPDSNAPQPSNLPKVSATGKSVEPMPNYQQGFVSFAKHLAGGYEGLDTVGPGIDMLFTDKSFEDSQKEIQQQQMQLSQMHEEDANNTIRYVQANNWTAAAGTTVSNVVAEGAAPLGISFAGGGALALGAAVVGLPVAAPFAAGTILTGGVIGLGTTIYNMRQHGADPITARVSGLAAISAGAATSFIGLGEAMKPGMDLVNNPQLKQTALQLTGKLAKSAGVAIGAMQLNNVVDAAIKYVGTLTASPDKKYTPKEIWNEFQQAAIAAFIFPPLLTLGFAGLGAVLGKTKPHANDNERMDAFTAEINRRERLQAEENARAEYDKLYGKEAAEIQRSLQKTLKGEVEVNVPGESAAPLQGKLEEGFPLTKELTSYNNSFGVKEKVAQWLKGGIPNLYEAAEAKGWLLRLTLDVEAQAKELGSNIHSIIKGRTQKSWGRAAIEKAERLKVLGQQVEFLNDKMREHGLTPQDRLWLKGMAEHLPETEDEAKLFSDINQAIREAERDAVRLNNAQKLSGRVEVNVPGEPKEKSAVKYNTTQLPKDNYLKPLSAYTDILYRETNVDKALELTGGVRTNLQGEQLFFANTPEMALGQGENKGVLLKFNSLDLQGVLDLNKPAAELSYQQGQIELIGKHNTQAKYVNALIEVTIQKNVVSREMGNLLLSLKDRGLTESTQNADGSVTYSKPNKTEINVQTVQEEGEPKALIGDVQLTDDEKAVVQALKTEAVKAGVPGTPEEIQGKLTDWVVNNRDQAKWLTDHTMPKKVDLGETTVKVKNPRTRTPKSAPNYDTSYIQKVINKLPKNKNGAPKLGPLIAQLTEEVVAVFQGKKPVKTETTENPVKSIFNLPSRMVYRYNGLSSSFAGLLDTAGQDTPPQGRVVLQGIAEYLHDVVQTLKKANEKGIKRLDEHLQEATGLDQNELENEVAKMASTKLKDPDGNAITYKNFLTGKISKYNSSEINALQDYTWAQDPEAQDGLRARGFTLRGDFPLTDTDPITGEVKEVLTTNPDTGEVIVVDDPRTWELQVERALGPEKLKFIKGAVAEFKEGGPELQTAFKQKTGEDLKIKDVYYSRIVREARKTDVDEFTDFENQLQQRTVGRVPTKKTTNPSITIERVKNAIPLAPTNFYLNAVANVRLRNQLIHTWQAGEVFNGVFSNQTVRTVVKHKGGESLISMIDASIEDSLHGPGRTQSNGDLLSNWIMGSFGVVNLGNNPLRAVMHATQLSMYSIAKNMNPYKLAVGVTDFWTDPVTNTKRVMNRPFIKGRYDSAMETFLNAVQSDNPATLLRMLAKVDEAQMVWLPLGDKAAVIQGWHAVFVTEKSLGKSSAEAARAADIATNSVMYSSSPDQLSHFGAGRVLINGKVYRISATKILAVAAQIPTKMFELQVIAIRDAIKHPSKATIAHVALVMATVRVANASFAAIKLAWDLSTLKSPERRAKAIREFTAELAVGPLPPIEKILSVTPVLAVRNSLYHKHDTPAEWQIYVQKVLNDIGTAYTKIDVADKHHGHSKKANIEATAAAFKALDELFLRIGIAPVSAGKRITSHQ